MVELGLLAVARIYWTVFDAPFGAQQLDVRNVLLVVGVVTAIVGALMCFLQSHLKRLLAYSTISHAGAMLVGVALLDTKALAGVASLVLSHALVKGGLFLCCGVLLVRLRSIDELRLHGRGREVRVLSAVFLLGAFGLASFPYVGTYLGHAQIDEGATLAHVEWVQPLLMLAAGVSAGAIARAGLRIFHGWGPATDDLLSQQPDEDPPQTEGGYPLLVGVSALLVVLGLAASLVPGLGQRAEYGAERFRDRAGYADRVLHGRPMQQTEARLPFTPEHTGSASWLYGLGTVLVAAATAAFGLWRRRIPRPVRTGGDRILGPPVGVLRAAHTGLIGDYVLYTLVGTALLGGIWAILLR
jgi:multicomponent Na+:H+ antiporter subunit D